MKANELRIGNLLQKSNGQIFTVSRLDNTNDVQVLEERGLFTLGYNLLGIPLTEEWLLKFGFEVFPSKHTNKTFNKGLLSIVLCGNYQYKNGRTYFNSWRILESQPKYVHQLQNLYFALTSQELTIKDDVGN